MAKNKPITLFNYHSMQSQNNSTSDRTYFSCFDRKKNYVSTIQVKKTINPASYHEAPQHSRTDIGIISAATYHTVTEEASKTH